MPKFGRQANRLPGDKGEPLTRSELSCQVIDRPEDLESLCPDWRALYQDLGGRNFFIAPHYLRLWWRHFGQASRPQVYVFRDDQGLRAIFPLRLTRRRAGPITIRVMAAMSNWESSKPQWLIRGEAEPVIDAWLDTLLAGRHWDVLHLPATPLDTPGLTYLWRRLAELGYKYRDVPCEGATVVDVSGDFETYWKDRPKKKKRNMRWAASRIQKAGTVECQISRPEDDPEPWIERLFDLAERTWQAAEGTGLNQPPRADFFADMIRTFLPQERLKIYLLTLDGRAVAFFLGYLERDVFYTLKTGYDQEFQQVYPGVVLLKHLLDDTFQDDNVRLVDFITSKPLFATWTDATAPLCDLVVYHHTPRGRGLSLVQNVLRPWSKRVLGRDKSDD